MEPMTPEDARARAIAQAGSDDFGPPDFEEGLTRTLDALARVPLTVAGRAQTEARIVADLATRLRISQWFQQNPQAARQEIEGPVLVVGMPRTGTTATVAMLALDEQFRRMRPPAKKQFLQDLEKDPPLKTAWDKYQAAKQQAAIDKIAAAATSLGFTWETIDSPIPGAEGNREFLLHTRGS